MRKSPNRNAQVQINQLRNRLLAVQQGNVLARTVGITPDTKTPREIQGQIDRLAATLKNEDWFTDSLTEARNQGKIYSLIPNSNLDSLVKWRKSPQYPPARMTIQSATQPSYKAPGVPDFDALNSQVLVDAMKHLDQAVPLNDLDRQRVKDAVKSHIWLGKLDQRALDRILQTAKGGSAKIADMAGSHVAPFHPDRTSLPNLMLEVDGEFGNDPQYWRLRDQVKYHVQDALRGGPLDIRQTRRAALTALGRTADLKAMDREDARARDRAEQDRYSAAHAAESRMSNPNYVGSDEQAWDFAKDTSGYTPEELGQQRFIEKAKAGANPIRRAAQQGNLDLIDLLPFLVHRIPTMAYVAGTGFSQTPEQYAAVAAKLNSSPELDKMTERIPVIGNIAQNAGMLSDAIKWTEGLWDGEAKDSHKFPPKEQGPYGWGESALGDVNTFLDWKDAAHILYHGARGFLDIAKSGGIRHINEPNGLPFGESNPIRPDTNAKQIQEANEALEDLEAIHQKGGYWKYIKGLNIKRILTSGKGVQLKGMTVKDVSDLAVAAQMLRDPRFEVLRYVFVKDGKVVHHEAFSSRLAGSSGGFAPIGSETIDEWLGTTIKSHNADGYYLLHNHPSGNSKVSLEDVQFTKALPHQEYFRGHVVVNSNEYSYIPAIGKPLEQIPMKMRPGVDPLHVPEIPHGVLGRVVKDAPDLVNIGKDLKLQHGFATMIGVDSFHKIRTIAEIPESDLMGARAKQIQGIGIARGIAHQSGSVRNYVVVPQGRLDHLTGEDFQQIRWALEHQMIADVVDPSGRSLAKEMGFTTHKDSELGPYKRTRKWH